MNEADHDSVDPGRIDYPHDYFVINGQLPLSFYNVQNGAYESISIDYACTVNSVYVSPNGFVESFDSPPVQGGAPNFFEDTYMMVIF